MPGCVDKLGSRGRSPMSLPPGPHAQVESVEVLVPPLPVNRVGSSVGSGRKDWRTSNVIIVSTDNTPDNVV